MSNSSRTTKPVAEELPRDLADLQSALDSLPPEIRNQVVPVFARVAEGTRRRRRILGLVQDALGQLRLDLKYLMFDLEATRRERDEYRRQVEELQGGA
jgi:hypothetical protein